MSSYFPAFEPRPGELAREALKDLAGRLGAADGAKYRVVDREGGVVANGSRDDCLDFVERAWWRMEAAGYTAERIAAAEFAERLVFERPDPGQGGYGIDAYLTNLVLDRHKGGPPN